MTFSVPGGFGGVANPNDFNLDGNIFGGGSSVFDTGWNTVGDYANLPATSNVNYGSSGGSSSGGSTPWWARIPEYLDAAGNVIRGFTGNDPYGFDAIFEGTQEIADYTNSLSDTTADQTRGILQDIKYSVIGQTPAEEYTALLGYPGTFYDEAIARTYGATPRIAGIAATPEAAEGFGNLDYSKQVSDLRGILDSYSPFSREGMELAKNPPVVSVDPSRYNAQIDKYIEAAKTGEMFDYSGPQTQGFLNPKDEGYKPRQEYTRQAMTDYYGGDKAKKDFMTYSTYS